MPRPQFTLRALLVAMLVVAAFFGGMAVQRRLDKPFIWASGGGSEYGLGPVKKWRIETLEMPDGSTWSREVPENSGAQKQRRRWSATQE